MSLWKALVARYAADSYDEVRIDASTNSLQTVDYAHHEIHAGSAFFVQETADIAAGGAARDFLLTTPNTTKWAHLTFSVTSDTQTQVILYEGTTTSADGVAAAIYNRNRNSGTAATMAVNLGPTVTSVGTALLHEQFGTAGLGNKSDIGGESGQRFEIVLKQNTKYLLRVINDDGSNASDTNTIIDWYEHTDAN